MDRRKSCSVCGIKGHNSSRHNHTVANRCGICGRHGHKAPTCGRQKRVASEKDPLPFLPQTLQPAPGFNLRRNSTSTLSLEEKEMATRVLISLSKEACDPSFDPKAVVKRTSIATGLNRKSIMKLKAAIIAGEQPQVAKGVRGRYLRPCPHRNLVASIHNTIEKMHMTGIMTSAKKVCGGLDFYHGIRISKRVLTTVLGKIGYVYSRPGPSSILLAKESESMRALRLDYLRKITEARKCSTIVYVDESYINENHHIQKCWLMKGSKVYIPSGKGPRYILYAAGSMHGWVGKPVVFKNSGSGDYHSGMNSEHFEELFEAKCATAQEQLGHCTFILDNASYHKKLEKEEYRLTYWTKMPAAEVKQAWDKGEVPGQDGYVGEPPRFKKEIIAWLRNHMPSSKTKVSVIAEKYGHSVLMLPPYHPELNAIETAWAVCKNYVAANNNPLVTFSGLSDVIERGLREATLSTWCKLDRKVLSEEVLQLHTLEVEDHRRKEFRDAHPDLIFEVDDDSDDSDDEGDHEDEPHDEGVERDLLAAVADGLGGSDTDLLDILPENLAEREYNAREVDATDALLRLQSRNMFEE